MNAADAALREAQASLEAARLKYESEIDGVNTSVAAQLKEAQYRLDNTTRPRMAASSTCRCVLAWCRASFASAASPP